MRARYPFGEWLPDTPDHGGNGLVTCSGVYARNGGYGPIKSFSEIADALAGGFQGGAAFVGSDGTPRMIATDGTELFSLATGTWTSVYGGGA